MNMTTHKLEENGFPALTLCEVPEGIDACVGKPPERKRSCANNRPLCRLNGCKETNCPNYTTGPTKDYFCTGCYSRYSKVFAWL